MQWACENTPHKRMCIMTHVSYICLFTERYLTCRLAAMPAKTSTLGHMPSKLPRGICKMALSPRAGQATSLPPCSMALIVTSWTCWAPLGRIAACMAVYRLSPLPAPIPLLCGSLYPCNACEQCTWWFLTVITALQRRTRRLRCLQPMTDRLELSLNSLYHQQTHQAYSIAHIILHAHTVRSTHRADHTLAVLV